MRHRRPVAEPTKTSSSNVLSMEAWQQRAAARAKVEKQSKKRKLSRAEQATMEMNRYSELGDWTGATGYHLAALYGWCHKQTYGVDDAEVAIGDLFPISCAAEKMIKQLGGPNEVVEYMRWAWMRERQNLQWRKTNGRDTRRMGWRLLFGNYLLTDYRVAVAQTPKQRHAGS